MDDLQNVWINFALLNSQSSIIGIPKLTTYCASCPQCGQRICLARMSSKDAKRDMDLAMKEHYEKAHPS